MDMNFNTGN